MKFLGLLFILIPTLSFANTDREGLIGTYNVMSVNYKHNGEPSSDHPWGKASLSSLRATKFVSVKTN